MRLIKITTIACRKTKQTTTQITLRQVKINNKQPKIFTTTVFKIRSKYICFFLTTNQQQPFCFFILWFLILSNMGFSFFFLVGVKETKHFRKFSIESNGIGCVEQLQLFGIFILFFKLRRLSKNQYYCTQIFLLCCLHVP